MVEADDACPLDAAETKVAAEMCALLKRVMSWSLKVEEALLLQMKSADDADAASRILLLLTARAGC